MTQLYYDDCSDINSDTRVVIYHCDIGSVREKYDVLINAKYLQTV